MSTFFMYALCVVKLSIYGLSFAAQPSLNLRGKDAPPHSKSLIFPDSAENGEPPFHPEASQKCRDRTFCEDVRNYPSNFFYEILEATNSSEKYALYFTKTEDEAALDTRFGKNDKYYLCPSIKMVVYPKAAYNLRRQFKFIYNLESYRQGIVIEVCAKKSPCKFQENVRNFKPRCKQVFVEKSLLTPGDDGKPYVDKFKFPSTCVCSYRTVTSYSRFSKLYRVITEMYFSFKAEYQTKYKHNIVGNIQVNADGIGRPYYVDHYKFACICLMYIQEPTLC